MNDVENKKYNRRNGYISSFADAKNQIKGGFYVDKSYR